MFKISLYSAKRSKKSAKKLKTKAFEKILHFLYKREIMHIHFVLVPTYFFEIILMLFSSARRTMPSSKSCRKPNSEVESSKLKWTCN